MRPAPRTASPRAARRARSGSEQSTCTTNEAPASSSAIGPCLMTVPRSTMATASHVRSHLVQEVRGQHHRTTLRHERQDHLAHVLHACGVESVHRLVEDQQLGIPDQAGGHAESLAHAHRVLRHAVVGAVAQAHPLQRRSDTAPGRRLACRWPAISRFSPPVRWAWNRGSSTMAPTRANARSRCLGTG